jgi:pyridoxine kinase
VEGDVLKGEQLRALLKGLERNELLSNIGHVLTGYIGSESFLEAVLDVISTLRKHGKVRYVCDPVLGDRGRFYVPESLVSVYKEKVLLVADVITPNQFEVEQLTGIAIETLDNALVACLRLHDIGPGLVFITSLELPGDEGTMSIVASERCGDKTTVWRIDCPLLPCNFTGSGDLCASLLLAHTAREPTDIPAAMEKVINTMYAVLERTHQSAGETVESRELKLIQSKSFIENPPGRFKAERIDMQGRRRVGSNV